MMVATSVVEKWWNRLDSIEPGSLQELSCEIGILVTRFRPTPGGYEITTDDPARTVAVDFNDLVSHEKFAARIENETGLASRFDGDGEHWLGLVAYALDDIVAELSGRWSE